MSASPSLPLTRVPPSAIAQDLRHAPSAPKVLPLLKRHLLDVDISIQQIVEFVRLDPGIAARVLQAGNSALFAQTSRCTSVEVAVGRIGFDHIYEIVANAVAEQVLVRPLTAYGIESDDFWSRSVVCGLAAESLAEAIGEDVNVAYTLGLLHGVGMVAIEEWVERNAPTIGFFGRGFPRDFTDSERSLLGCNHAEVGAAVLRQWEFPPEMCEPVRWQYSPLDTIAHRRLNCLLYGARWLGTRVLAPASQPVPAPEPRFLAPIGCTGATLAQHIPQLRARFADVERRLGNEPGEAA